MNPLVTVALTVLALAMLVGFLPLGILFGILAFLNHRMYARRVEAERQRLQAKRTVEYDRMLAVGSRAL